jgi:outer membrane phospholipase A
MSERSIPDAAKGGAMWKTQARIVSAASQSLIVAASLFVGCASYAADTDRCFSKQNENRSQLGHEPVLCSYEPNTIGWTKDSDDVGFMDFKLSVRYQIFPFPKEGENWATYFAFTGRFGQYIGTRDSSPVVAKRFNPKIFFRHWADDKHRDYVDIGYNHESNGQSIHTLAQFQQAQQDAQRSGFAYDQISRGWDFLDLVWKKEWPDERSSTYLVLKYFLPRGLLQGKPEEYGTTFAETDPEGKPRNQVNGVGGIYKRFLSDAWCLTEKCKFAATYETGYRRIARYNTFRLEYGFKVSHLPLTVWGQTGYGSDLAQYYKKVSSLGFEVEIGSF